MDESMRTHHRRCRRLLSVEALEERTLLSVAGPLDHLAANPAPLLALAAALANRQPAVSDAEAGVRSDPTLEALDAAVVGAGADRQASGPERYEHLEAEVRRAEAVEILLPGPAGAFDGSVAAGRTAPPSAGHPENAPADAAVPKAALLAGKGVEGSRGQAASARGEAGDERPRAAVALAPAESPPPRLVPTQAGAGLPAEDPAPIGLSARVGALLEGGLPLDLPLLKRNVDEFFVRLAEIAEGGDDMQACARLGPWLIVLTAATLAAARRWDQRSARRAAPGDEVVLGPAALLTEEE